MSTTSRQLTLSTEHTDITLETIEHRGITDADLPYIAEYLTTLTENGQHLAALAGEIFKAAEPGHPSAPHPTEPTPTSPSLTSPTSSKPPASSPPRPNANSN